MKVGDLVHMPGAIEKITGIVLRTNPRGVVGAPCERIVFKSIGWRMQKHHGSLSSGWRL
jgi:hypothetical protein